MRFWLEIWGPDGAATGVSLEGMNQVSVGRGKGNDLVIDDPTVSRRHLVLERLAAGWSAHDVQSTNGTLVNGEPIGQGRPLYPEDQLLLGDTKIVYRSGAG